MEQAPLSHWLLPRTERIRSIQKYRSKIIQTGLDGLGMYWDLAVLFTFKVHVNNMVL